MALSWAPSPVDCSTPVGTSSVKGQPTRAPAGRLEASSTDRQEAQMQYTLGTRTFTLDTAQAEAALAAKRVVGGRETPNFNLLPLRYGWAYELYRTMKANHWEPEDVQMAKDIEQWRDERALSEIDRWIVRMGIGYFSAAEGIVGDNVIGVVRELVTASELKLVLGRHAHEENIHADSLLYMIASLGIDPHECEAMFSDVGSIADKNRFVTETSRALRRDLDMADPDNVRLLARNVFVFGQCMEGTQFYGLFGMILSLYRQGKLPGIGTMFRYTLRDESNHIELFRRLLGELVAENPGIWTPAFKDELRELMREAVALEQRFIADCLPVEGVGLSSEDFSTYIDYIADRRLQSVGLEPLRDVALENPLPWLAELMDVRKEQNFFEGRVTEYQKASSLAVVADEEL
jgi:ribonucleoside-diphosphate reductase beta chain